MVAFEAENSAWEATCDRRASFRSGKENVFQQKKRRTFIKTLTLEEKSSLETFTFGDPPSPVSTLQILQAPGLGLRLNRKKAIPVEVPEKIYVTCPGQPALEGCYTLLAERHNNLPMWGSGENRIFSSTQGLWSIVDSPTGPESDLGWVTTVDVHGGLPPTAVTDWQHYNGSQWEDLQEPPVSVGLSRQSSQIPSDGSSSTDFSATESETYL
eukprot:Sspe_Gene.38812::Locus_18718_Transcript_1_1_Confidence_1.000_Length_983::g.38812::m.38812